MRFAKRLIPTFLAVAILAGCGSEAKQNAADSTAIGGGDVLIAYFSRIGNIDDEYPVDAIASASVVVQGDTLLGNTQYMATLIQNVTGGTLHFIETAEKYPSEYDSSDDNALDIQVNQENRDNARPALATQIEKMGDYDTVFLGFPNWYGDMPMAVYSFLEKYDLSDKQIYLFNTSGGSGASNAYATIEKLEPEARVESNILSVSHSRVADLTAQDIEQWLSDIGFGQ